MRKDRNRNRKSDSLVSGCRKVKPKIVLVYIKKNINIIAQQTNDNTNKKKWWVVILHTRPNSSLRSDINLCIKFFCCPLWLNSDIWLLIFALKSRAVRLGDFYNQLQVNSHVWKAGYADTCQSIVITANSLCVFFSKLKSPDICLKMLTQVNKIIRYINSYQSAIN